MAELKARCILMDGSTDSGERRMLLSFAEQTLVGLVLFEFVQRKAEEGFGEDNFKAHFASVERDQI